MYTSEQPLVSIIMNCYNGEKYLREAIDSIYAQTYQNWEIIFWDNCSTDNSAKIAKAYDKKLKYYYGEENVPLGAARKYAVEKTNGIWIGFLDTDDLWFPNKLEIQISYVLGTDYVLCYAGIEDISPNGMKIRELIPKYSSGNQFPRQLQQFDINMVTPIVNKKILEKYKIDFDKNIIASEEYNLFMRLAAKGPICTIPEVLGVWRILDNSLTNKSINHWSSDRLYTLKQLKRENPKIEMLFPKEFQEAFNRGVYYKARYLMNEKKYGSAVKELKSISLQSKKYFFLFICSFFPIVWNFLHKQNIKRKLSPKMLDL